MSDALQFGFERHSLGDREGAEAWFRKAIALEPDSARAHLSLAVVLLQAGNAAGASDSAERAAALEPGLAQSWMILGTAHRRLGRWPEAARAFETSLTLDPNQAGAALSLGLIHADLDQVGPAIRWLERAVELAPDDSEAHAALSAVYCSADRFDLGRTHAELALALNPSLIGPHQYLARILAREGDLAGAKHHRDAAYGARSLQVAEAPHAEQRVLVLALTDRGNTPDRHLLPADRYTRLYWYMEYASEAQMSALPDYDVVFNAIGDQDETGPTAAKVERFLKTCRRPVFNRPERIARTCRDMAPALFEGIEGLVTPKATRLEAATIVRLGLIEAAREAGLEPPMIVRPLGSHGGEGARLIASLAEPDGAPAGDAYVTAFHDVRSPDGFYRKYRIIFVDREPYPYHLGIGPHWMVHYATAETAREPAWVAEELRFLEDPQAALGARAMAAIRAVGRRLDLDFAGVDFAVTAEGEALLFEANATMLVHPEDPNGPLAHKNPFVMRICEAFQAMLRGG